MKYLVGCVFKSANYKLKLWVHFSLQGKTIMVYGGMYSYRETGSWVHVQLYPEPLTTEPMQKGPCRHKLHVAVWLYVAQ